MDLADRVAFGIGLGALVGAIQGFIIAYGGVPAFIVTLGGFLVWRGMIFRTGESRARRSPRSTRRSDCSAAVRTGRSVNGRAGCSERSAAA